MHQLVSRPFRGARRAPAGGRRAPFLDALVLTVAAANVVACMVALPAAAGAQERRQPAAAQRSDVAPRGALRGVPGGALRVRLVLADATLRAGDALAARVRVEAPGGKVRFTTPSGCLADVEVRDARGRVVATTGQGCAAALTSHTAAPGAPLEAHLAVDGGSRAAPALAPGRYRVRALVVVLGDGGAADTVRSPAVALRVRR